MLTTMRTRAVTATNDGINWYYEQEGSGPDIVLIPDGLGECQMFDKPMSLIAARGFRVTTFDMPGMSRSSEAHPETYQGVTAQKLARYVVTLLDELKIDQASFFGCSSGASTVLAIVVDYPGRVRNAMPHEAPAKLMNHLSRLVTAEEGVVVEFLTSFIKSNISDNPDAWDALGEDAHARMRKNYVKWARGYPITIPPSTPLNNVEALKQRPLDWTVGASTPTEAFFDNIVTGVKVGATVGTLPGQHFPYVSHPVEFAEHVINATRKYT